MPPETPPVKRGWISRLLRRPVPARPKPRPAEPLKPTAVVQPPNGYPAQIKIEEAVEITLDLIKEVSRRLDPKVDMLDLRDPLERGVKKLRELKTPDEEISRLLNKNPLIVYEVGRLSKVGELLVGREPASEKIFDLLVRRLIKDPAVYAEARRIASISMPTEPISMVRFAAGLLIKDQVLPLAGGIFLSDIEERAGRVVIAVYNDIKNNSYSELTNYYNNYCHNGNQFNKNLLKEILINIWEIETPEFADKAVAKYVLRTADAIEKYREETDAPQEKSPGFKAIALDVLRTIHERSTEGKKAELIAAAVEILKENRWEASPASSETTLKFLEGRPEAAGALLLESNFIYSRSRKLVGEISGLGNLPKIMLIMKRILHSLSPIQLLEFINTCQSSSDDNLMKLNRAVIKVLLPALERTEAAANPETQKAQRRALITAQIFRIYEKAGDDALPIALLCAEIIAELENNHDWGKIAEKLANSHIYKYVQAAHEGYIIAAIISVLGESWFRSRVSDCIEKALARDQEGKKLTLALEAVSSIAGAEFYDELKRAIRKAFQLDDESASILLLKIKLRSKIGEHFAGWFKKLIQQEELKALRKNLLETVAKNDFRALENTFNVVKGKLLKEQNPKHSAKENLQNALMLTQSELLMKTAAQAAKPSPALFALD